MEPPTVLRIKRKRGQDPLQALVLEDKQSVKRSKPSSPVSSGVATPSEEDSKANFYFKLTRTDNLAANDILVLNSILNEASNDDEKSFEGGRKFVIPKPQTEEDVVIPNELSDMVNSFMISTDKSPQKRRRRFVTRGQGGDEVGKSDELPPEASAETLTTRVGSDNGSTVIDGSSGNQTENDKAVELNEAAGNSTGTGDSDEVDDYVYDVYQLSPTAITTKNHPKSQIGYIKFFNDDDEFNMSESSFERDAYSDNEDSNAEDYYQNDYPEDEDADIDEDIHNGYKETELENEEVNDLFDYVQQNNVTLVDNSYKSDEDADYVYGQDGDEYDDFDDDDDDDDYDIDNELDDFDNDINGFERQHFFDGDSEDELAIHRDKIFSKLQKMVDES